MAEEELLFTKDKWDAASATVTREMNAYLAPFVTAVSKDHGDYGKLVGSGTYIEIAGRTVILTNEHVAAEKKSGHLIHKFHDLEDLYRSTGDHLIAPAPADMAILPISSAMWKATNDSRFDATFHLGVDYKPDLATKIEGSYDLPPPPGFSESTLWNTRFVECSMAGIPWTPEQARVTGLVWGWPTNHGCIVATRAELLHEFIDIAAQQIISADLKAI